MNTKTKEILEDVKDRLKEASEHQNIANSERLLSVGAGAFVLYTGITGLFRTPLSSLAEVAVGSYLILRGATGYCAVKDSVCPDSNVTIVERIVE
ncbi:YgaP family membrane protein [Parapedobacter sp. DT-150]|uniref:YgaP family membrane protein n=1 Tax=Parapedobacter sp. DT-150 TaxID=3396162 RepID=UPI003F1A6108